MRIASARAYNECNASRVGSQRLVLCPCPSRGRLPREQVEDTSYLSCAKLQSCICIALVFAQVG